MLRKLSIAWLILSNKGLRALWRELKAYFRRPERRQTDECRIAFDALRARERAGVMIDVGAHFGGSLMPFASHGWTVFAFEPDSINRRRLQLSVDRLANVIVDARAVSDRFQPQAALYSSAASSGISGLSAFHATHQQQEIVEVVKLAQYFDEQPLLKAGVDFLKIDTEGFDLPVLKGFPWQVCSPRLILCEFEDAKTGPLGYSFNDLAEYLVERGYRLIVSEWYPIEQYGTSHRWRRFAQYPCELQDPKAWGNILAARDPELFTAVLHGCEASTTQQ